MTDVTDTLQMTDVTDTLQMTDVTDTLQMTDATDDVTDDRRYRYVTDVNGDAGAQRAVRTTGGGSHHLRLDGRARLGALGELLRVALLLLAAPVRRALGVGPERH